MPDGSGPPPRGHLRRSRGTCWYPRRSSLPELLVDGVHFSDRAIESGIRRPRSCQVVEVRKDGFFPGQADAPCKRFDGNSVDALPLLSGELAKSCPDSFRHAADRELLDLPSFHACSVFTIC